jgi:DNA-binding GntR family transcriptional regulator
LLLRELTAKYGVGVIPLREALCQLAGDGLVILETQRGFRVAPVSAADLADVSSVRSSVEPLAVGLSIDRGDGQWQVRLREALDQFTRVRQKVGDSRPISEEWDVSHRRFHFALIYACGSPTLLRICGQIYDRFDRYRRLALPSRSFMAGTAADHDELAALALAGDRKRAIRLLRRHISDIAALVSENFSNIGNL